MFNYSRLEDLIKKIVVNLLNVMKLSDILFGTVTSIKPIVITTEQKLPLNKNQLILSRNVTEYKSDITLDGVKKEIINHNDLEVNDKVLLLRLQGGQRFLVLDKVGEW